MLKKYAIRFVNELLDFRLPEFHALASLFNLKHSLLESPSDKPYLLLETDNEEQLLKVLHRSVLAQSLYELWVSSDSYAQFYADLQSCDQVTNQYYHQCSFRIQVETFGKKISMVDKVERIEKMNFLPFHGPIRMKNPDVNFHYFEYFGQDANNLPEEPYQIFFGRWISDSNRKFVSDFSLKKRKFIANTSMEPTLAFLMSNMARVNINDIVYDPFVGSGSLLVSAAYCGAYVLGTDIDYLLLHGLAKPSRCGLKERDKDESVRVNLKQYQLESRYLDVVTADSSLPLFRPGFELDAIVTDPPYGRRESRERIGTTKNYKIPDELVANHIPSKLEYHMDDIYCDLLNFAAQHLRVGGRILFWAPFNLASDQEEVEEVKTRQWPQINFFRDTNFKKQLAEELRQRFHHPNFKFISFSEQNLSCRYSRFLISMERVI